MRLRGQPCPLSHPDPTAVLSGPFLLKERFKRFATVGRAWDMFLLSMVEAAPADRVADFYGVFFSYLIDAQLGTASAP
jgi:hypothetical protein